MDSLRPMMKWLNLLAAAVALAIFGSCERHSPEALNRLPGHHEDHGEAGEGGDHAAAPHAEAPAPAAAPSAMGTPPSFFH